jgi:hypothetical protein
MPYNWSQTPMLIYDPSSDNYRNEQAKQLHMTNKKQQISTYE